MVAGRGYWIIIWFGIMFLGLLGFGASIYWGLETSWKNLDELVRAIGTIVVSTGMLLLLYGVATGLGQVLLVVALICFVLAFVLGRKYRATRGQRPASPDETGNDQPRPGA